MNFINHAQGKCRKIIPLVFIFLLAFTVTVFAAAVRGPSITADAAIVYDTQNKVVLFEKNADKREYPASTTKIMTAVLALEEGNGDRSITVSPYAANVESTYLEAGNCLRQTEMLEQMLQVSDNAAATAIGEAIGGSEKHFTQMMTLRAKQLGATHTNFVNCNGMPDTNHYTTARDMAKIATYAMTIPEFRRIVGAKDLTVDYIVPEGHKLYCENTNDLLWDDPTCTGIKTGFTMAAGACLVASAKRNGRELIAVVFKSRDHDTRFTDAEALLNYGFRVRIGENHLEG